jgi:polysaccharide export outer membrane protein
VAQVVAGVDRPDANFSVMMVTRDTPTVVAEWPNSHPAPSLGWIAHQRTSSDPLIQAGDTLSLAVWDNDDTSLLSSPAQKVIQLPDLRVLSDGTIFLPYIDQVYVAKMTPDEARKTIQDKLLQIIPSAQVQLTYASGTQNSVVVVAGVPNPGRVSLTDRSTTVTSVIAQSGGVPNGLANPQVNLQRDGKLYRISAQTLLERPELDTTLRGGDKVFITADDRYFMSLGASGKQAIINFTHDQITTLEAMSMIGGLDQGTADPKGILILRNYPASAVRSDTQKGPPLERMIFSFNLTTADGLFSAGEFKVEDRDLVLVTQSPLVNTRTIVTFVSGFLSAGRTAIATTN